jgi:hypothetical protein
MAAFFRILGRIKFAVAPALPHTYLAEHRVGRLKIVV